MRVGVLGEHAAVRGLADRACTGGVQRADVLRHLRLLPSVKFTVGDTADVRASWVLETVLKPRTGYALMADSTMIDAFGQRLTGNPVASVVTTGYAPAIDYPSGRMVVEREALLRRRA